MSLAVADRSHPADPGEPPSYQERARLILLRHPGLFLRPIRGGGLSRRGREPLVQSGSRTAPQRRRMPRQLALPLQAAAAVMLG
ncbi:MAG TPA: hypothetical protein VJU79_01980 [Candidatus Dormibacteraeota bacterium]|nr:hypothetical protein [Candidatus Dormibacteraeota bacterium]